MGCYSLRSILQVAKKLKLLNFRNSKRKFSTLKHHLRSSISGRHGPCIKELPHFDELGTENEDVKVYLVSVDFQSEIEKVKRFVTKKSLSSSVLFLDEKDPDSYMSKVSNEWTGAIPATLFVTDMGKTYFHEKAFTKEDLETAVNKYLN